VFLSILGEWSSEYFYTRNINWDTYVESVRDVQGSLKIRVE
jgi:hypothetical protein